LKNRVMDKREILTCKLCNQSFDELSELDSHIKLHKIKKESYYRKYYPRNDLFTGDPISFTNSEFYLTSLFNNKNSLKAYFKNNNSAENTSICLRLIKARMNFKKLNYIPCQVEARSLVLPAVSTMLGLFDYEEKLIDFGLKKKLKYDGFDIKKFPVGVPESIVIDTREKKPLTLKTQTETIKLDHGDYATSTDSKFCIERKSLTDLVSTISGGYDRFLRELDGAKKEKKKIVVLVEDKITNCLAFNKIPYYARMIKAQPSFIFHRIRHILQNYKDVQFLFIDGRKEAARFVEFLLVYGNKVAKYDLQYLYDTKQLRLI